MWLTKHFLRYIIYTAFLCLGIIIGIAVNHYYQLPLAEAINIVDLATLVTTIFLAVYIPEVLDRKLEIQRDKKDLIEKRIEELQALYRRINLIVQGEEPVSPKDILIIQNLLDVTNNKLNTIITLLTYSNMHVSFQEDIKTIRLLASQHKNLLWLEQTENPGFTYPDSIQQQEEALYNKIDETTCLLILKISEA